MPSRLVSGAVTTHAPTWSTCTACPEPQKEGAGTERWPWRGLNGAPGVTRTPGTQFRKLLLYPPELRGHAGLRCTQPRFYRSRGPGARESRPRRVVADADQELPEVLSLEKADEGVRGALQADDHVFSILELPLAHPAGAVGEEVSH